MALEQSCQQTNTKDFLTYDEKLPILFAMTELKDFVELIQKPRQ